MDLSSLPHGCLLRFQTPTTTDLSTAEQVELLTFLLRALIACLRSQRNVSLTPQSLRIFLQDFGPDAALGSSLNIRLYSFDS